MTARLVGGAWQLARGQKIHEHQNPQGNTIEWNKSVVIRDLSGPPNYWDAQTIENNMFRQYDINTIRGSTYDPDSIMHYVFPSTWTKNGVSASLPTRLSEKDKYWLAKTYPRDNVEPPEPPVDTTTEPTETDIDAGTDPAVVNPPVNTTTNETDDNVEECSDKQTVIIVVSVIAAILGLGLILLGLLYWRRTRGYKTMSTSGPQPPVAASSPRLS